MAAHRWFLGLALAAGVAASAGLASGASIRTLFLSGQAAPAGLAFASFGRAAANARGSICFFAGWDSLYHRPEGLFLRRDGQVLPIVRAGDPVPGQPGERFSFPADGPDAFNGFSLNSQDQVAFLVQQGLYLYADGAVRAVARIGDPVPGTPDETWDEVDAVSINSEGTVAFVGAIRSDLDGDRQAGVFLVDGGAVKIALFEGDQPPDVDGELTGFSSVALNDAGQIATLAQEGDDQVNCVLLTSGANTSVLAVEGQPAPGGTWTELDSAALNQAGAVAFQARVQGDAGEHGGIYLASGGAVTAVALPGQTVTGTSGGLLGDGFARPVLDDDGKVAFLGALSGAGQPRALVESASGPLVALAVEGQPAPGALSGTITRFSGLNLGSMSSGTLVCGTAMRGGSVGDSILRFSTSGPPEVILTTAAPLPPGAVLTLTDGETAPSEVQARSNRRGDLVFAADVGGYGRALFRMGPTGAELLTPLSHGIRSISAFDLNDSGQIAYLGVRDEADQDTALFTTSLEDPEGAVQLVTSGDPVVGGASAVIRDLGPPLIDGTGAVIFAAQSLAQDGGYARTFLLRAAGDGRAVLAAAGQPITGAGMLAEPPDADPSAQSSLFRDLRLSRDGQILFLSSYQDAGTGSFVTSGLFLLSGDVVSVVALPGQQSPLASAFVYTSLSSPRLSDSGTVTFTASVVGPGRKSHFALFRRTARASVALATAGDPAPGLAGTQFRSFLEPAVNAAGDVAFYALLDPPPAGGAGALFIASGGTLRLVIRDVELVDAASGATVRIDNIPPIAALAMRDDGSVLIAARLRGGTPSDGLFLVQP